MRRPGLMTFPDILNDAFLRLGQALDHLDAAAARRAIGSGIRADREQEFTILQDDRSRLALELDAALAHSRALDLTNTEVSERLARASATVRTILSEIGPARSTGAPVEPT